MHGIGIQLVTVFIVVFKTSTDIEQRIGAVYFFHACAQAEAKRLAESPFITAHVVERTAQVTDSLLEQLNEL